MQNEHDYKAALSRLEAIDSTWKISKYKCVPLDGDVETIKRALLLAEKLMREPSEQMVIEAAVVLGIDKKWTVDKLFKAMRDQLLKELDNDK